MNSILSYKAWLVNTPNSHTLASPYASYLDYVNNWYGESFGGKTTDQLTAEEYRNFLITLNIAVRDPDIASYVENLDYSNPREVQTAIPFFANSLKKIVRYISERRDCAKKDIFDYKYLNSTVGVEREMYNSILEVFLGTNYEATVTELLELFENVSVEVEELYDDNNYLDKSPELDAESTFDMEVNRAFFSEHPDGYLDWILESGFSDLVSNDENINPPISGTLPLSGYIDYNVDSEQTLHYSGKLASSTMGEEHYYISGGVLNTYASAEVPWNNVSNRYYPTIANFPLIDATYSKYDKGGFFIPSKLGMPVALGLNKYYKASNIDLVGNKMNFPNPSKYSNGFGFTGKYQESPIVYNSHLNWIDIKQSGGSGAGVLTSDGTYQEMSPYQTSYETTSFSTLGIDQIGDVTSPWYLSEDNVWRDDLNYPSDFRKVYDIDEWYDDNVSLTGHEDHWAIDVYGNNYGLYKDEELLSMMDRRINSTGKLYVRGVDGKVLPYDEFFSTSLGGQLDGFELNSLTIMNVYNDLLIMEDVNGSTIIQKVSFEDGIYSVKESDSINTLDIEESGKYMPFGHYFDDRDGVLYLGRCERAVNGIAEIVVYKYENALLEKIYSTREDTSKELLELRFNFTFDSIKNFPSMTISPMDDKLILTYICHRVGEVPSAQDIVIIPLIISGGYSVDEIVTVRSEPYETYNGIDMILIDSACYWDKLVLTIEDSFVSPIDKYLQVIPL